MKRLLFAAVCAAALFLVACGGDSDEQEAAPPTSVTAADLTKTGEFWNTLTPDLKDELVGLAKDQEASESPDRANEIQARDTDQYVAEIDKQYTNAAKRAETVEATYAAVVKALAMETLSGALNQLDQLCDSEPRPPECDE